MPSRDCLSAPGLRTPAGKKRLVIAWALLLLAGGELLSRGGLRAMRGSADLEPSQDFALYYCSARAMMSGSDPYQLENLRQIARQTGAPAGLLAYAIAPPVCFVPLAPLAALSWPPAKALWMTFNLLMTGALLAMLAGLTGARLDGRNPRGVLLAALVLGLAPVQTCIALGQLAVVGAAGVVGALYTQKRGRPWLAGALLGASACFKPQMAAVFLAYWLLRGRWKGLAAAAGVGGAAAGVCAAKLAGVYPAALDSWRANLDHAVHGGICDYANPGQGHNLLNLQYPLYQLFGSRPVAESLPWVFVGGMLGLAAWAWRRKASRPDELLLLSLLAVVGLLPIYHVWYDAALLAVPLGWALSALRRPDTRRSARAALVLVLPFLVPGPAILAKWGPDILPNGVWSSWWWQAIVMPYQAYLAGVLAAVLLAALFRQTRAAQGPDAKDEGGTPREA